MYNDTDVIVEALCLFNDHFKANNITQPHTWERVAIKVTRKLINIGRHDLLKGFPFGSHPIPYIHNIQKLPVEKWSMFERHCLLMSTISNATQEQRKKHFHNSYHILTEFNKRHFVDDIAVLLWEGHISEAIKYMKQMQPYNTAYIIAYYYLLKINCKFILTQLDPPNPKINLDDISCPVAQAHLFYSIVTHPNQMHIRATKHAFKLDCDLYIKYIKKLSPQYQDAFSALFTIEGSHCNFIEHMLLNMWLGNITEATIAVEHAETNQFYYYVATRLLIKNNCKLILNNLGRHILKVLKHYCPDELYPLIYQPHIGSMWKHQLKKITKLENILGW